MLRAPCAYVTGCQGSRPDPERGFDVGRGEIDDWIHQKAGD
jgi:hypothetical protein